jgi:peptidylprolyl isomerase
VTLTLPVDPNGVFVRFSNRRSGVVALISIASLAVLTACGSSGSTSAPVSASSGATSSTVTTKVGVTVSTGFGGTPTVTIPAAAAPTALSDQVITQGTGPVVASGDTIAANYVGETWAQKNGKVNVFDSSFSRGTPAGFVIGTGAVIPGWDKELVGQKIGSRVLLSIPPADGYGTSGQSAANISGTDTLVFVIDLVASYKPGISAPGTVVSNLSTAGLPKITNVAAKEPKVLSTAGVPTPTAAKSVLLVTGSGAKIDSTKTLVLELVETDLKTGKDTQSSWAQAPQTVLASSVLGVASVLTGQNVGARALILVPPIAAQAATATAAAVAATPAEVLIVDVVGQF